MNNVYEAISGSSVALIGMCKNSGKTTVLNKILELMPEKLTPALTSIGRDGEEIDVLTLTPKPRIFVRPGSIVATARMFLEASDASDATLEILHPTGFSSPLGEILVVRALSGGFVQISGPSMTEQLVVLKDLLKDLSDIIIIDGAMNRKSQSIPALCDCCILCAGAACSPSMDKVVEETAHVAWLFNSELLADEKALGILRENSGKQLVLIDKDYNAVAFSSGTNLDPAALREGLTPGTRFVFAAGAVTDAFAGSLPAVTDGFTGSLPQVTDAFTDSLPPEVFLVAEDASKFLISSAAGLRLRQKRVRLSVLNKINLNAVCINPVSPDGKNFDKNIFLERMQRAVVQPVFNVM